MTENELEGSKQTCGQIRATVALRRIGESWTIADHMFQSAGG